MMLFQCIRVILPAAILMTAAPAVSAQVRGIDILNAESGSTKDEPAAVRLKVVTKSGHSFSGMSRVTKPLKYLFRELSHKQLSEVSPKLVVEVINFNDVSGSIGIRVGDMKSIEVVEEVSKEEYDRAAQVRAVDREAKWAKERARLAKVAAKRAAKKAAEALANGEAVAAPVEGFPAGAGAAGAAQATADNDLPEHMQRWLDQYPPEDGWLPARKAQLYYQSVVLGNGSMSDQERYWLDHYDEWFKAFDVWFERQQAAGKAGNLMGFNEPGSPANQADANAASAWTKMPEATRVSKDAPKPTRLATDVTEPTPIAGGGK